MAESRTDDRLPPLTERGQQRQGADVGGMASTADAGLADAEQRSMEARDEDPTGVATVGEGMGGTQSAGRTDLGGKNAPGSAPGADRPSRRAERAGTTTGKGRTADADPATPERAGSGAPGRSGSRPGSPQHEIDEPRDEGAVESFGRSIGEVVLGSDEEEREARERGR